MPKLIDYPRTTYSGAWELAEVVDDTGGKCAIDTAARKLNRKVSGSFKAIIGSAVKFGLLTSKRELLTTTTLFKRIKHAYDKQEELLFHREAFLTPPLFTQLCRKFRSRELPVQMLDVMLIREFGVEEINAQGVAKAFVEGCRMVGLMDEREIVADIDALGAQQPPRRELASPRPSVNTFRHDGPPTEAIIGSQTAPHAAQFPGLGPTIFDEPTIHASTITHEVGPINSRPAATAAKSYPGESDAIASLFGLPTSPNFDSSGEMTTGSVPTSIPDTSRETATPSPMAATGTLGPVQQNPPQLAGSIKYQIQVSGPGVNTSLSITEEEDIALAIALLEKIRRQLKN
ncbi:MAG: hypothetical protein JWR44_2985 [Hymenobacter sp.]|jgi:hypothetical protein|nr:hypothetical protein [Hymenobacter sp.]